MATTQSTCNNRGSLAPNQSERNRLNAIKCIGDYLEDVGAANVGELQTSFLACIMGRIGACDLEWSLEALSHAFIKSLPASELTPHPLIVARSEVANAIRYWRP